VGSDEVEYLYCELCHKVTAVNPDRLDETRQRIKQEFGYTARFTHFAIVGVCEECATAPDKPRSRSGGDHHLHSHGDHVHSHPHDHAGGGHTH
jgi:hypothetical protein